MHASLPLRVFILPSPWQLSQLHKLHFEEANIIIGFCLWQQQSCLTRKAWWQRLVSNGNAGFCLNCCFSIFWTVASQSRIENSQSGWFNKIRQSGMDLLKRGDNINLISDKQPLNMFSILGKFQLCIILKQRMLLEQRESVWTRKICLSFFQHWPLLALDREYWRGFGGGCWYQISHFCNWRGECYLCPPDPSLSKYQQ